MTREVIVIEMWAGQLACEGLNWILKRLIKQERPLGTSRPYCRFLDCSHSSPTIDLLSLWNVVVLDSNWFELFFESSDTHGHGYGFPSSHSQYMAYFSTFLILHLHFRHRFTSTGIPILDSLWRIAVYSGLVLWAGVVCYSRSVHPVKWYLRRIWL